MHVSGTGTGNDNGRVAVIGLDGAVPELAFERYADRMPTLARLREEGAWGRLRSIDPPITVPAWSCAMSGLSPGALGIYGFRNRRDHTYDRLAFATSRAVPPVRVWERLSDAGRPHLAARPGARPAHRRLLRHARRRGRRAARGPRPRRRRVRHLRPRRPAHGRRLLHQRVAAPAGVSPPGAWGPGGVPRSGRPPQ